MKPGRNDSCPCGSGKKFKKCCHDKLEARTKSQPLQQQIESVPHNAPSQQEINALMSLFNQQSYLEAELMARSMTEKFPQEMFCWKALGVVFQKMGRNADALAPMQKAVALSPNDADAHYNLGVIFQHLGRPGEAEASYRRASQINPNFAEAHISLGVTLKDMGRLEEAEACYRRALQISPNHATTHYNLGVTLKDMGRLGEAEVSYRRALQINPNYVEAHSNLGATLKDMGRLEEAEASFLRALQIKPNHVTALNNLASLFNAQGKSAMALSIIKQSLQIKETWSAKSLFAACAKHLHFAQDDSDARTFMIRALTEPWGRPNELAQAGIDLVNLNPGIRECITRATNAWPLRISAQDLFGVSGLTTLATDPLLLAILESSPICDIGMERFLTVARCAMLETAASMASSSEVGSAMSFYSALTCQCFINEYVFSYTDDEIQKASDLRNSLIAALEAQTQVPALWPVTVAAYFPLYSLQFADRLLDRQWPDEVTSVLLQQICDPEEEHQLRVTLPRLTKVEDEVSLLVQNQYEENPYPRWIKMALANNAKGIDEYFLNQFPLAAFRHHGKSGIIDILVAGCGTGQHSIEAARRFQGARVLAIDLSISSLSYAKRKTRELGLTSIEYAQADLLKLCSLGRSFDIIESVGVLHHLADPWAGWQVLLSLLRSDGFMRLGFYSEIARRNIVKARAVIAKQGCGVTPNEIRSCRQNLVDMDKNEDSGNTFKSPDFFSTSACRDLLFHVQEHRMTLTGIEAFLRENHLAFLGFEIDVGILRAYKCRFPDDLSATNLAQWHIFENENPDIFSGMYQFWVQKMG